MPHCRASDRPKRRGDRRVRLVKRRSLGTISPQRTIAPVWSDVLSPRRVASRPLGTESGASQHARRPSDLLQFCIEQDHQTPREIGIGCLQTQKQMTFMKPARERVRKASSPVVHGFSSIEMSWQKQGNGSEIDQPSKKARALRLTNTDPAKTPAKR